MFITNFLNILETKGFRRKYQEHLIAEGLDFWVVGGINKEV